MRFVYLSLISSLLCLDVIAVAQVMISRPIVVGAVLGYAMGDVKSGLFIGAVIELVWISVIPVGFSVPPDVAVSAVLASCWYLTGAQKTGLTMMAAIMVSVPAGMLFKKLDIAHRQYNVTLARRIDSGLARGDEGVVGRITAAGVALFFLKAFVFFVILMPAGAYAMNALYGALPPTAALTVLEGSVDFALAVIPAVGLGVLYTAFRKKT
jgi:PTS system N-acetylgalactosamine-specific IIC component/PTS system mannose-specific IIC component/fructoselysine and glucoselysine-specific PTS system IIC component